MWPESESLIYKQDLALARPYVNAAGTLGFAPDPHAMPFLNCLGAFITNPISRRPRQPAANRGCLPFPGGFLLHTGLANPSLSKAIAQNRRKWAGAPLPIIVHLLVETPNTLAEMVRRLEGMENLLALELGLPPDCNPDALTALLSAAEGELPAVVCLGPEQIPPLLETLLAHPPAAVHLTEPRGTLPGPDGELVTGRLYGPAIFPQMLSAARTLVAAGLPVIANGGVYQPWQADALLEVGAMAVGLAGVLWGVDPNRATF